MTVNKLYLASSLIEKWNAESMTLAAVPETSTGSAGAYGAESVIYARSDPRFLGAIEPGIRPLVLAVIGQLGCITYSSCEGHHTSDGYVQVGQHVDIFAPDLITRDDLALRLDRACVGLQALPNASLRVRRGSVLLEHESALSISIEIVAAPRVTWVAFEADAKKIQSSLIKALQNGS